MRATYFVVSSVALCACLDFDVFRTEPTTGSTSSAGGGGAGGDGGGSTASTTGTTTGMGGDGGMGGSGGGPIELPPCGGLTDDFDAPMADLMWDLAGGASFANDRAVTSPPNGSFRYIADTELVLSNCRIQIDVAVDTNQTWFFGWVNRQDGNNVFWFATNNQNEARVIINDGGLMATLVGTNEGTKRVRISHSDGEYRVETADIGTSTWNVRFSVAEADAPAWLAQPGYPQFGTQGAGSGTNAEFDDFNPL